MGKNIWFGPVAFIKFVVLCAAAMSLRAPAFAYSEAEIKKMFDRSVATEDLSQRAALRLQIVKSSPDSAYGLISKAYLLNAAGRIGPAQEIALYTQAIEKDPGIFVAYNNRGLRYNSVGQYDKALADFNKTIALNPGYLSAYSSRGDSYRLSGKYDKAIENYDLVLKASPGNQGTLVNRGAAYMLKKNYYKGVEDFTAALELGPEPMAYNNRCHAYGVLKEYDKAIADCDKALELAPDYRMAYVNRAQAYSGLGRFEAATADRLKIVELEPEDAEAWNMLGDAYYNEGKFEEAVKADQKAVSLDPDYRRSYLSLCMIYQAMGKYQKAIDMAGYVQDKDPGNAYAWIYKGQAVAALGRPAEALKYFGKAAAAGKNTGDVRRAMAEAYLDLGNTGKAYGELRTVASLERSNAANDFILARLNYVKGDKRKAAAVFTGAVTKAPNYTRALRRQLRPGAGGYSAKRTSDYRALFKMHDSAVKERAAEGPMEEE